MVSENETKSTGKSPSEVEKAAPSSPQSKIPTWRLVVLIVSLCIGLFLSLLDTTIVATTLYTIGTEFHAPVTVNWIVLAYLLAYLGCATIFASISNVIGRRNAYLGAFTIFLAFSIGCGFSHSIEALIACRTAQGIGGSGLYTLALVIFGELCTPKLRKSVSSMVGLIIAIAGVLGPVLGGVITHYTTWRWIFWINAPIGIIPLLLFAVAWPKPSQLTPFEHRSFRQLDWIGCMLLITASILSVFAFQQAGLDSNAWKRPIFIAPLVVGLLCWLLLIAWEVALAQYWEDSIDAIIPLRMFKSRVFSTGVLATLLTGFTYLLVVYNLPVRLEAVNQKSPLGAGVGILPLVGGAAVGSIAAGVLCAKKDRTFPVSFAGSCCVLIGSGLLSTLDDSVRLQAKAYGYQIFVGMGFGLTVASISVMASFEVQLRDTAIAQGIVAQLRSLGGSLGVAASAAVRGGVEQRELGGPVSPNELAALASPTGHFSGQMQLERKAFADAYNESMVVCSIIAGICVVVSLFLYRKNPAPVDVRRKANFIEEMSRRKAKKAEAEKQSTSVTELVSEEKVMPKTDGQ